MSNEQTVQELFKSADVVVACLLQSYGSPFLWLLVRRCRQWAGIISLSRAPAHAMLAVIFLTGVHTVHDVWSLYGQQAITGLVFGYRLWCLIISN